MIISDGTKAFLKKTFFFVCALLLLSMFLGQWKLFFVLGAVGAALAYLAGQLKTRSKLAWWVVCCLVVALLYGTLLYPQVDRYMAAHWPMFWQALHTEMVANDIQYGQQHMVAGNAIDAARLDQAVTMDEISAANYQSVTEPLMAKLKRGEVWTREDSLAFKKAQEDAETEKWKVQHLMSGGILPVSDSAGKAASSIDYSRFSKLLKVDITTADPTELTIPKGHDVVIWVDMANYMAFDSIGTAHKGSTYTAENPYSDGFCGAGGFNVAPGMTRTTFPNAFVAPGLNMFATLYRTSIDTVWSTVPPKGMLTVKGSSQDEVTVEFTINDRKTTFSGNSGVLVIGYNFQPKSRLTS